MNSLVFALLAALLPAATVIAIGWLPVVSPPAWAKPKEEDGPGAPEKWSTSAHWRRLAPFPIVTALAAVGVVLVPLADDDTYFRTLSVAMSTGVVTLVFMYSLITDLQIRLVDRRIMNWAMLASAVTSVAWLVSYWSPLTAITAAVVWFLGALAYLFLPSLGASDARALMLIGIAAVPPVGYFGFMWGTILASMLFIVVGFGTAILKRRMKISIPAVPILLGPYLLMIVYSAYSAFKAINMA